MAALWQHQRRNAMAARGGENGEMKAMASMAYRLRRRWRISK